MFLLSGKTSNQEDSGAVRDEPHDSVIFWFEMETTDMHLEGGCGALNMLYEVWNVDFNLICPILWLLLCLSGKYRLYLDTLTNFMVISSW